MSIIPAEALKNHIAILGKTGSGKSATARLIVEKVVADDFRVCILDSVKSDWWGITNLPGTHPQTPPRGRRRPAQSPNLRRRRPRKTARKVPRQA
jgi:DNA helicase HerA-like ATPase